MIVGGIDPGKEGFAAVVDTEQMKIVKQWTQPLLGEGSGDTFDRSAMRGIAREMRELGVRAVGLELQLPAGRTRATPQALFRQGQSFGLWQQALTDHDLPCIEVIPQAWRKGLGCAQPKILKARKGAPETDEEAAADKKRLGKQRELGLIEAIRRVQSLFPGIDLRRTEKATTPCADLAVAILLAMFAAGVRVDGGAVRSLTPEEAAKVLEGERERKAAEASAAKRSRDEKKQKEQEAKKAAREKIQKEREEKKRLAAEAKAKAKAEKETARAAAKKAKADEKARRAAEREAQRANKNTPKKSKV